jgi:hypothetical protein
MIATARGKAAAPPLVGAAKSAPTDSEGDLDHGSSDATMRKHGAYSVESNHSPTQV